jgi:hypothetical protein
LYRGIIDLKRCYQPRTNIVKGEKVDLVADFHSVLARWMNHFSQLLNIDRVNDVIQTEIHTTKPHVPEMSVFEFQLFIEKLKSHISPGIDQITLELVKAGG